MIEKLKHLGFKEVSSRINTFTNQKEIKLVNGKVMIF